MLPEYIYRCPESECHHEIRVLHSMNVNPEVRCPLCGGSMRRKPQRVYVNWGGLKPSQGAIHPNIQHLIDDAPRRREELS